MELSLDDFDLDRAAALLAETMSYRDFTLETALEEFGVALGEADLFPAAPPVTPPAGLADRLNRRTMLATITAKARDEFLIAPILLAARDLASPPPALFSGHRLDVDPARRLAGACDFLLAAAPPVPPLRAPILMTVYQPPDDDMEASLGPCIAQMVAARQFNLAADHPGPVHGCVTTGEVWQFLKFDEPTVLIDRRRYYLSDPPAILGVIQATIARSAATPPR